MALTAADAPTLEVAVFRAGGFRFAVEAATLAGMRAGDGDVAAPTIESLLGLAHPLGGARRVLLIKKAGENGAGAGIRAVTVADGVTLVRLSAAVIHPLPELARARSSVPGLKGLAFDGEGLILLAEVRPE